MSNIPKGATHYLQDMGDTLYYREKGDWFDCWFDGLGWESSGNKRSQLSGLVELNKKPVFTQAMADAWELPKVGMMVNHLSVKKEVILPADSNDKYVLKSDSLGCYALALLNEIKPIDTRTDKEKAIDYMEFCYEKGNNMEDLLSEIVKGYVIGVKWVGE